ncbi:hypothetical protein [Nocardia fusca]|uniref:hypothetical protein n=1 Tax=Nocardia fusca TaxID=941183 RepID=UPI0007A73BDA|nr:hypothetical protein [Nocardia fusca]
MARTRPIRTRSFCDFAARVAEALGPGWTAGRSGQGLHRTVLHGPVGQCLNLAHGDDSHRRSEHGRNQITTDYGDLDQYLAVAEGHQQITVAATRTPTEIAADISRRLLPEHETLLASCRERAHRDDLARIRRSQVLTDMCKRLVSVTPFGEDRLRFGSFDDPVSGELRVRAGGTVEWKFTADSDLALELATVIGRHRGSSTR